jgi:hypothetical protein
MTLDRTILIARKNFHLKLAQKRGLVVNKRDIDAIDKSYTDINVQKNLERASLWRKLLFRKNVINAVEQ